MRHAELLAGNSTADLDHTKRAFGRYYTPRIVATRLARDVAQAMGGRDGGSISCIDPFCGDGRLVSEVMRQSRHRVSASTLWRVVLRDLDAAAVVDAVEAVASVASELGLRCEIDAGVTDAFSMLPKHDGEYDVVVTNPPWEVLKPDRREMGEMSAANRDEYLRALRAYDSVLATKLPCSQPATKFSGWGTNLSRCGLELALRLSGSASGVCGIVLPASIMNDQSSARLRRWMIESYGVSRVSHYPAEAKLFDGVDQPFVTVVTTAKHAESGTVIERFQRDGTPCDSSVVSLTETAFAQDGHRVPCDIPGRLVSLLSQWQRMPTMGDLEGKGLRDLWMGRELDETGYARFTGSTGAVPFVKGRMIRRYAAPLDENLFITDSGIRLPESTRHARVAWRDVSRRSQRRRVQATIIPAGVVTGNSVHVAYFRDDDDSRLLAILALLNSTPVELQVRSGLGTGHVSLGVIRAVRIPDLRSESDVMMLASLARQVLDGDSSAIERIESAVAKLYGLDPARIPEIERFFLDPYAQSERRES